MEYLKIWTKFEESVKLLGEEEAGRLFVAMLHYARTGKAKKLKGNERILWPTAREHIDAARGEYERKKSSGSKGGRPRKETEGESGTEKSGGNQAESGKKQTESRKNQTRKTETLKEKVKVKEKDKVKDKVKVNVKEKENEKENASLHPSVRQKSEGDTGEKRTYLTDGPETGNGTERDCAGTEQTCSPRQEHSDARNLTDRPETGNDTEWLCAGTDGQCPSGPEDEEAQYLTDGQGTEYGSVCCVTERTDGDRSGGTGTAYQPENKVGQDGGNDAWRELKDHVEQTFGRLTEPQERKLRGFVRQTGTELVAYALDSAADHGARSFRYLERMMERYGSAGVRTAEEARERDERRWEESAPLPRAAGFPVKKVSAQMYHTQREYDEQEMEELLGVNDLFRDA